MTYINLSRHDARLRGDLRLRLARHPYLWMLELDDSTSEFYTGKPKPSHWIYPIIGK